MDRVGGIYIMWLSDTHYYGGRTVDFKSRWRLHQRLLQKGKHTNQYAQAVYNKYGVFHTEVLEILPPDPDIHQKAERDWLDNNFGKPGCLNIWNSSQGSHIGWHHSEKTKEKFKNRRFSDETKKLWSENRKGHPVSDETREKCSAALKGKKRPDVSERNIESSGWKHTEEAKHKIEEANRTRTHVVSEESRKKISDSLKGSKHSEETKRKRSESMKKLWERRKRGEA